MSPRARWLLLGTVAALGGLALLLDVLDVPSRARDFLRAQQRAQAPEQPHQHPARRLTVDPLSALDRERFAAATPGVQRLLAGAPEQGSPRVAWVRADRERRAALDGALPYSHEQRVRLPSDGELWLSLNHSGPPLSGPSVRQRVLLAAEGAEPVVLLERVRSPWTRGWDAHRLDLSQWSGREVALRFEARAAEDPAAAVDEVRAYFGDLLLRSRAAARARPNVVLVLLDTLRPDHLGAYGYARATSPTFDRLAADGARFDRAFSVAPWTSPSIASLFTGLYPSDVWTPGRHREIEEQHLPPALETLAGSFVRGGYHTLAISDHPGINAKRFGHGFDAYAQLSSGNGKTFTTPPDELLARVDDVVRERGGGGVFLYLHLMYPHLPYAAPEGYHGLFGEGDHREEPDNREALINLYDAQVRLTDDALAGMLALLEREGMREDLILALVADHGEAFWEHDLFAHGNSLYNELLRIPLVVHAPGRVDGGRVIDELAQIVDVGPTLLELAGLEVPETLRGVSLAPLLSASPGAAALPRRVAFSEFAYKRMIPAQTVQDRDGKWIVAGREDEGGIWYDLRSDAGERRPLRAPEGAAARALSAELAAIRESADRRRAGLDVERIAPDAETLEQLRALGYTD